LFLIIIYFHEPIDTKCLILQNNTFSVAFFNIVIPVWHPRGELLFSKVSSFLESMQAQDAEE